jgi:hypothetical protein
MVSNIFGFFWARVMSSRNETDDLHEVRHIASGEETMISGHAILSAVTMQHGLVVH